jgi:Spy/CpxP family protein refolding chaperone
MKARNIILAIAAVIILAAPMTALAQAGPGDGIGSGGAWGGGGHGRHGGGQGQFGGDNAGHGLRFFEHMLPRLAEELGLSDEQLTQIQAIVDEARPQIENFAQQLRDEREAYRAADDDPTYFDEAAFLVHAEKQHGIQTQLGVVAGHAKAAALDVLTEEQLAQLEEMRGSWGRKAFRRSGGRRSTN